MKGFYTLVILIACAIGFYYLIQRIQYKKRLRTPLYPQYIKLDDKQIRWTNDQKYNGKSFLCPWCRHWRFVQQSTPNEWGPFCKECDKKIRSIALESKRPSYIDEQDWEFIAKGNRYWIIYKDYELGCINDRCAQKLMRQLLPKNFGIIQPITYRGHHDYIESHQSAMGSSYSSHQCAVCFGVDGCRCEQLYKEAMETKKWPKKLNQYFEQLRVLQPKFIIKGYYRKDGKTFATTEPRSEFMIEDYFTFDDWQSVQWIMNFSTRGGYTKEIIEAALDQYIQLIAEDLKILIRLHGSVDRGEHLAIPVLPSTNPDSIGEIKIVPKTKTVQQELEERYLN